MSPRAEAVLLMPKHYIFKAMIIQVSTALSNGPILTDFIVPHFVSILQRGV